METLFIGNTRIDREELDSTNTLALELIHAGTIREGAMIVSKYQSDGRGQRGNSWESERGKNLMLSFVLNPVFLKIDDRFELTKVVSLAVAGMAEELINSGHHAIEIKWPNDIFVNGKKIAGILIENVIRDQSFVASVIGIGVNVNQEKFGGLKLATSLSLEAGQNFDPEVCLKNLCVHFEARYLQLKAGKREKLNQDYLSRLYRLNEEHEFFSAGKHFVATITGITPQGKLKMKLKSGEEKEFELQEVKFEN